MCERVAMLRGHRMEKSKNDRDRIRKNKTVIRTIKDSRDGESKRVERFGPL